MHLVFNLWKKPKIMFFYGFKIKIVFLYYYKRQSTYMILYRKNITAGKKILFVVSYYCKKFNLYYRITALCIYIPTTKYNFM